MIHSSTIQTVLNVGCRTIVKYCNKTFNRAYYKEPFNYERIYRGKFDYHDTRKCPKSISSYKEEELLEDAHSIKGREIDKPSPFHIVQRIRGTGRSIKGWSTWVTLRRLNLHSSYPGDIAVIPNTPQYNAMIAKVKHLLKVTPAVMPDEKMPSEEDVGALKICPETGRVTIDERLRLLAKRQFEKPSLWKGAHMRFKLRSMVGAHNLHYIRDGPQV